MAILQPTLQTFKIRLYVNNFTPNVNMVFANFNEPVGTWYAPILLNSWGIPFINLANQGEIDEVVRSWTVGGIVAMESVWGYWITDPLNNVVWAELNPAGPQPMSVVGQSYSVLARLVAGDLC